MSAKLIYHTAASMAGGVSPFDTNIMSMIEGEELRIACPYLGLSYLNRVVERAEDWRLLTDVQEWLSSRSPDSRNRVVDFILENSDRIRHCKDLHAKALITSNKALIGSANFTDKGITGRVEVSVLFDGCDQVDELKAWFELLWGQTRSVAESDLRACVATLPASVQRSDIKALPSIFPGVSSNLMPFETFSDAEERLLTRLRFAPDRQWAESWLDLAKRLVESADLDNNDPRLVMSLPQRQYLPITINSRYVLTAFCFVDGEHENHAVVELILPAFIKDRIQELPGVIDHYLFDEHFSDETAENVPLGVGFSVPSRFSFSPEVLDAWQEACLAERDRQKRSQYRKSHEPVVYRAVTDLDYRRRLLDLAFPA